MGLGGGEAAAFSAGPIGEGELELVSELAASKESQASGRSAVASAPAASIIAAKSRRAAASKYCSTIE